MLDLDSTLKILQIAAALFVGGAAVFVSFLQYKSNRLKLRLEIYEKRLNVYNLTREYLRTLMNDKDFSHFDAIEFKRSVSPAKFLFKNDVNKTIRELFLLGLELDTNNLMIEDQKNGNPQKDNPSKSRLELKRNITRKYEGYLDVFGPYLDLSSG